MIILTVVFLAGIFKNLPKAVLAVVVMNSVVSLMDVKELRRFYALRRTDFAIALVALAGVVVTDVLTGLVIAVVISLIFIVYRASRPYIALLGRAPESAITYGDLARHPEYEQIPGLMIVRLDAPLYFLNAGVAQINIRALAATQPHTRAPLIDIGASGVLDVPTMDLLADVTVTATSVTGDAWGRLSESSRHRRLAKSPGIDCRSNMVRIRTRDAMDGAIGFLTDRSYSRGHVGSIVLDRSVGSKKLFEKGDARRFDAAAQRNNTAGYCYAFSLRFSASPRLCVKASGFSNSF